MFNIFGIRFRSIALKTMTRKFLVILLWKIKKQLEQYNNERMLTGFLHQTCLFGCNHCKSNQYSFPTDFRCNRRETFDRIWSTFLLLSVFFFRISNKATWTFRLISTYLWQTTPQKIKTFFNIQEISIERKQHPKKTISNEYIYEMTVISGQLLS